MENIKDTFKEKSKKTFNSQANIYDSTYNGKHASKLYNTVVEKVNSLNSRNILDVGCGTGTILSVLAKNETMKLSGIDLSENMLNIAKEKLKDRVNLVVGDSEELPWQDSTFDTVICTDSFHHYPKPEQVLKEMARVLENKGNLIIGDPWMAAPLRQIANAFLKYSKDGDYRIYSEREIVKLLNGCGFTSIRWHRLDRNSFVVAAIINKGEI